MGKGDGMIMVYLAILMYSVGFLSLLFSLRHAVENGEHVGDYYLLAIVSFFMVSLLLYFEGYPAKLLKLFLCFCLLYPLLP
jgi:ABC-type Na+ efflux pump permease subunit